MLPRHFVFNPSCHSKMEKILKTARKKSLALNTPVIAAEHTCNQVQDTLVISG